MKTSSTYATSKETLHEAPHQSTVINTYANVYIGVTIQKLHQLSDDRITRETLSNNNPCPSSPSSTIYIYIYIYNYIYKIEKYTRHLHECVGFFFLIVVARKEMLYLTTHSMHFIYSYMTSDIW